jgi:hypothetical protein
MFINLSMTRVSTPSYRRILVTEGGDGIATARQLLGMPVPSTSAEATSNDEAADDTLDPRCPCCGSRRRI